MLTELATILPGAGAFAEVFGAAVGGLVFAPAADGANGGFLDDAREGGVDLTWEGAGHFKKGPGGEEGDDFDGDAHDEGESVFGGGDDGPADKRAGAKEGGEHGVEEEHLGEGFFPATEPFFGVGEKRADEGQGADHNKKVNESLAGGDGEVGDADSEDGAEEDGEKGDEDGAKAAGGADDEAANSGAADKSGDDAGEVDLDAFGGGDEASGSDLFFDASEEAFDGRAGDVADVNEGGADDVAEVD